MRTVAEKHKLPEKKNTQLGYADGFLFSRGGSRNSLRGGGGVLGQNSSKGGG